MRAEISCAGRAARGRRGASPASPARHSPLEALQAAGKSHAPVVRGRVRCRVSEWRRCAVLCAANRAARTHMSAGPTEQRRLPTAPTAPHAARTLGSVCVRARDPRTSPLPRFRSTANSSAAGRPRISGQARVGRTCGGRLVRPQRGAARSLLCGAPRDVDWCRLCRLV